MVYTLRLFYRCPDHGGLRDVPADAGFLCDKAAVFGRTI